MQAVRSIFERITAEAIIPMVNLGLSGAIAAALLQLYRDWQERALPAKRRG